MRGAASIALYRFPLENNGLRTPSMSFNLPVKLSFWAPRRPILATLVAHILGVRKASIAAESRCDAKRVKGIEMKRTAFGAKKQQALGDACRIQDKAFLKNFVRGEDGTMVALAVYIFLAMMVVGGIGVDLMAFEMNRTRLQHTLDRAVLAAADIDQTLTPEDVVTDYFQKSGMEQFLSDVQVDQGVNYRTVSARATARVKTQFIHMVGIDTFEAPAYGAAEERIGNVEISLVLDVSGSMKNNNRLPNLRTAAKTFVDTVIRDENEDRISLSIVPYSEHVNVGEEIFDLIPNTNHRHDFSHCVEMRNSDFSSTTISSSYRYDQMQHFTWNYDGRNNLLEDSVCPLPLSSRHNRSRSDNEITAYSQDASALKAQIDSLTPISGTAIYQGMKWGVALLDPSTQGIVSGLTSNGNADPAFDGRPKSYSDVETLKTVILMTDGENTSTKRIADWAYDSQSDYVHWDNYNFNYYLYNHVRSYQRSNYYYTTYQRSEGDAFLHNVCEAAKDKGIIIWSIGFEVTDTGANVMEDCASSPSHFFRVEGIEIEEAFKSIARQINQLRLTQ